MRCFACNTDAIPTTDDMDGGYYFCGGEAVCVCGDEPLTLLQAVDDNDDEYEFRQGHSYPELYMM